MVRGEINGGMDEIGEQLLGAPCLLVYLHKKTLVNCVYGCEKHYERDHGCSLVSLWDDDARSRKDWQKLKKGLLGVLAIRSNPQVLLDSHRLLMNESSSFSKSPHQGIRP